MTQLLKQHLGQLDQLRRLLQRFVRDEDGLELLEYALLGVLILVALVGAYAALSTPVASNLQSAASVFATQP